MARKLWQKSASELHPAIEAYTVGTDYVYDDVLVPYDVQASIAHAKMLEKIGILSSSELMELETSLKKLQGLWESGDFVIELSDEDCHTKIENYLVKNCGDLGKKIHTGRSRNDQVLVAMHLYMKNELLALRDEVLAFLKALRRFKKEFGKIAMPGYTHMQRAMPMSIGMWIDALIASLKDDLQVLGVAFKLADQNPLGSAAGFGVPKLKLDRAYTTKLLGFRKAMNPPLYCQNSRPKIASFVVSALSQVMLSMGKMASDLLLFTTQEFNFFTVDDSVCTGSSIMPQKRNLDAMEIFRANVSLVQSYEFRLKQLDSNLISGYHRDWQLTKEPVIESFNTVSASIEVLGLVFDGLKPKKEALDAAMSDHLFATEKVYELVAGGMSFRDAYLEVKKSL